MSKALYFVSFAAGLAVGALASWKMTKAKYLKKADEEIEQTKLYFDQKYEKLVESRKNADKARIEEVVAKYKNAVSAMKDYVGTAKEKEAEEMDRPYSIPPDDLGEFDEYSVITLIYYADGVLADELDEEVDDVEGAVGDDLEHKFGEYEDDVVCIRNDSRKCDYEIIRDERLFSEVIQDRPHIEWSDDE